MARLKKRQIVINFNGNGPAGAFEPWLAAVHHLVREHGEERKSLLPTWRAA